MKISTKKGDKGFTSLINKKTVAKNSRVIELIGAFDELNALLGEIYSMIKIVRVKKFINNAQNNLFKIGAEVAGYKKRLIFAADVKRVEKYVIALEKILPNLKKFILPGGDIAAAKLHIARAVCRRAERRLAAVNRKTQLNPHLIPYLNRLSDALFLTARTVNMKTGANERIVKF